MNIQQVLIIILSYNISFAKKQTGDKSGRKDNKVMFVTNTWMYSHIHEVKD